VDSTTCRGWIHGQRGWTHGQRGWIHGQRGWIQDLCGELGLGQDGIVHFLFEAQELQLRRPPVFFLSQPLHLYVNHLLQAGVILVSHSRQRVLYLCHTVGYVSAAPSLCGSSPAGGCYTCVTQ